MITPEPRLDCGASGLQFLSAASQSTRPTVLPERDYPCLRYEIYTQIKPMCYVKTDSLGLVDV